MSVFGLGKYQIHLRVRRRQPQKASLKTDWTRSRRRRILSEVADEGRSGRERESDRRVDLDCKAERHQRQTEIHWISANGIKSVGYQPI